MYTIGAEVEANYQAFAVKTDNTNLHYDRVVTLFRRPEWKIISDHGDIELVINHTDSLATFKKRLRDGLKDFEALIKLTYRYFSSDEELEYENSEWRGSYIRFNRTKLEQELTQGTEILHDFVDFCAPLDKSLLVQPQMTLGVPIGSLYQFVNLTANLKSESFKYGYWACPNLTATLTAMKNSKDFLKLLDKEESREVYAFLSLMITFLAISNPKSPPRGKTKYPLMPRTSLSASYDKLSDAQKNLVIAYKADIQNIVPIVKNRMLIWPKLRREIEAIERKRLNSQSELTRNLKAVIPRTKLDEIFRKTIEEGPIEKPSNRINDRLCYENWWISLTDGKERRPKTSYDNKLLEVDRLFCDETLGSIGGESNSLGEYPAPNGTVAILEFRRMRSYSIGAEAMSKNITLNKVYNIIVTACTPYC